MLQIGKTIVSLDILEKEFCCNLAVCKGACCIHGDSGAPLEPGEPEQISKYIKKILPLLSERSAQIVKETGVSMIDTDGDIVTPLRDGKECVYTIFEGGVAKCAIEKLYLAGKIKFWKPISCHLYPVRITKYYEFDAVNYHSWVICNPAVAKGKSLNLSLVAFLKEPLIRKYGKKWYKELEEAHIHYKRSWK